MTPLEKLRATLDYHGFHAAAAGFEGKFWLVEEVLAEWADYPRCMDRWPKVITGRKMH